MSTVTSPATATSDYLKAILDRRAKDMDERLAAGVEAGKITKSDQAALGRQDKQNAQALAKATSDGILDRTEYQRLVKALGTESRSLDRILKVKTAPTDTSGNTRPMEDQDGALKLIQDMQKRMHETIQKALSGGSIGKSQGKSLDTQETAEQGIIDKALADGVVSKGEYAQIAKAQSSLGNKLKQYQSDYRKNGSKGGLNSKA